MLLKSGHLPLYTLREVVLESPLRGEAWPPGGAGALPPWPGCARPSDPPWAYRPPGFAGSPRTLGAAQTQV